MKCTKCTSYVSGDYCQICGTILVLKEPTKKKIPKRSEKGKEEDKVYYPRRKKFLKDNPRCAVYSELKSEDVHHKRGRGIYYLDVSTWLAVSRRAHTEINENPEWAIEMGYSELRLKKYDTGIDNGEDIQI